MAISALKDLLVAVIVPLVHIGWNFTVIGENQNPQSLFCLKLISKVKMK